tara:strand:- start:17 stop:355 length:339 start_codon:yes stop_codon:yes gene_type:complete
MDNYEINILRRSGDWKKIKPNDLIINEIEDDINEKDKFKDQNFLSYIVKVNSIIQKLENLETEKNKLKEELKIYENEFMNKKNITEKKISKIFQEKDMIDKTLNIIKNLRNF